MDGTEVYGYLHVGVHAYDSVCTHMHVSMFRCMLGGGFVCFVLELNHLGGGRWEPV